MNINKLGEVFTKDINKSNNNTNTDNSSLNFADALKKELNETNEIQKNAQAAEVDIATGNVKNLAQATIAIEKAELNMKMMLEVRNKAINAYKELLKTQM